MAIPATTGTFRTTLASMKIGDYIACQYVASISGAIGTFSNLGVALATAQANEISLSGTATPNGYFYLLKVDNNLLIADRNVQISISLATLNTNNYLEGKVINLSSSSVLIRSISGGAQFVDTSNARTTVDNNYGCYPINNEWDKYIVNSTLNNTITKADDNVWHKSTIYSWTRDSSINGTFTSSSSTITASSGYFTVRAYLTANTTFKDFYSYIYSTTSAIVGFRPIIEYIDSNSKNTTLFY